MLLYGYNAFSKVLFNANKSKNDVPLLTGYNVCYTLQQGYNSVYTVLYHAYIFFGGLLPLYNVVERFSTWAPCLRNAASVSSADGYE